MPITKDLQPDEFELTVLCPIGSCIVQHTYAFNKKVKTVPGGIKEIKGKMINLTTKAHKEGRHNIGGRP